MAKDAKAKEGSSGTVIVLALILGLGALGLVFYFQDQATKAEKALLQAKEDYKEMQQRMKKPVEEFLRQQKPNAPKQDETGDLLIFLDRKAREAGMAPGSYTIARNATSAIGPWQESSYTVTLQSEKKDSPIKRNPVVDFLALVEKQRKSTRSKSIQLTFAGDDLKSAIIGFSQFQTK